MSDQSKRDLIGITVGGIQACCTSIMAPLNFENITPDDHLKLEQIYKELYVLTMRLQGIDAEAEERRMWAAIEKKLGRPLKP